MRQNSFIINMASLYVVQFASLILPLITLPYLARVLKPEALGEFAAVQALAITLSLIIEYGFNFSATRQVSLNRHNLAKLAEIADRVFSAKIILCIFTVFISCLLKSYVPEYSENSLLFGFGIFYAIAQGFNPLWYFQGIEYLPRAALIEVTCRAIGTLLLFIFIKTPDQVWLVMAIQATFIFLGVLINYKAVYNQINPRIPSINQAIQGIAEGWSMFLFRASVSLYTTANTAVLRLFVPASAVADYSNSDKLVNAAKSIFQPVTQVLFPRISHLLESDRDAAVKLLHKSSLVFMFFATILTIIIWLFAPKFIPWYLGVEYSNSIHIVQLLSLSIPIIAFSNILGVQWMLPLKMDRAFNSSIILGGAINIVLILCLVPQFGNRGMAYSVLMSEIFIDLCMTFYLLYRKQFPFNSYLVDSSC